MSNHNEELRQSLLEKGPFFGGISSFARLPYTRDLSDVSIAILGIPFELATPHRSDTRYGPRAIRKMSLTASQLLQSHHYVWPWRFKPLENHKIIDYGDIHDLTDSRDSMMQEVQRQIEHLSNADVLPLILGGNHFISYPILQALAKKHQTISLVHFDAHADYLAADSKNSPGMFQAIVEEGLVDPTHSVQVGIRTDYDQDTKYNVLDVNQIIENGPDWTATHIRKMVGDRPTYLTFDIDFLDPAYAPATSTPVIGGPTTHFARRLLTSLSGLHLIGADLVEVSPSHNNEGDLTSLAAAQLALDLLHLLCQAKNPQAEEFYSLAFTALRDVP